MARADVLLVSLGSTAGLRAADAELVHELVEKALQDVGADELVESMRTLVRQAQRAEPFGVLAQTEQAHDDRARWRPRRHLAAHWEGEGKQPTLVTRVGRLHVPADQRDAVAEVLDGIRDPAELDHELRRRLALAGLLVPEDVRDA